MVAPVEALRVHTGKLNRASIRAEPGCRLQVVEFNFDFLYPCLLSTLASPRAAGIKGVPRKSIVVDPFRCW
jgi:hypothetical protein